MTVPLVIILVALIHQPLLHVLTIHFQICVRCTYLLTQSKVLCATDHQTTKNKAVVCRT